MQQIKEELHDTIQELKYLSKHKTQFALKFCQVILLVLIALVLWASGTVLTHSESPVVVVLSESMEPAIQRGDILFLNNPQGPFEVGEIVVFKIRGRNIPIIHRVLRVHEEAGEYFLLTKGDNNYVDDRGLYAAGQKWLKAEDIIGRARLYMPYLGMVTIYFNDYPWFKWITLSVMGLYALLGKDE